MDLVAEPGPDERADRVGVDAVRGEQRLEAGAQLARATTAAGWPASLSEVGRHAEQQALGDRVQPVAPHERRAAGRRRQRVAEADARAASAVRVGHAGAGTRRRPRRPRAARRTAWCGSCRRGGRRPRTRVDDVARRSAGQRVRGGQPGDAAADDDDAPVTSLGDGRRRGRRARRSRAGSSLTQAVRSKARPRSAARRGPRCRGRTAPRGGRRRSRTAHTSTPSASPVGGQVVDRPRGCRGRATARACGRRSATPIDHQPSSSPSGRRRRAAAVARSSSGYGIAGVEDPLGQRVGGEQHPGVASGIAAEPAAHRRRRGTRRRPARSPSSRSPATAMPSARRRPRQPVEVLADRERRVVRRQHQADDRVDALRGERRRRPSSMIGAACFRPSATSYSPRRGASSAACSARRCASVRSASGEMPPIAS